MSMMILQYEGKVLGKYPVEPGQTLSIGRREDNDIVVGSLIVSGHHAKLEYNDKGFLVTDLKSKNGTLVNGNPIQSHWLKNGDVITVGKHRLLLQVESADGMDIEVEDEMEQTMVIDMDSDPDSPKQSVAVLSFIKGGSGDHELTKKLTKIGKDHSNDIVISGGFTIGKTVATISKLPDGWYISFVGGMTKPKVNGRNIGESALLKDFDTIEIGSDKMQFLIKEE